MNFVIVSSIGIKRIVCINGFSLKKKLLCMLWILIKSASQHMFLRRINININGYCLKKKRALSLTMHTVNDLKFQTLYSILFWLKFCFLNSCFLKYFVDWQTMLTLIRLLLQEQSDLGLLYLHMAFCQKRSCSKF